MYKISTEKGENKMAKFVPLAFLKETASIVEFCQECGEPVFVTRNGTPELVIMDSGFFDEYLRYRKKDGRLDIRRELVSVSKKITIKDLKTPERFLHFAVRRMSRLALYGMAMVCW